MVQGPHSEASQGHYLGAPDRGLRTYPASRKKREVEPGEKPQVGGHGMKLPTAYQRPKTVTHYSLQVEQ
jgi:hypothetical protein